MNRTQRSLLSMAALVSLTLTGCGQDTAGTKAATSTSAAATVDITASSESSGSAAESGTDNARAWNAGGAVQIPEPGPTDGKGINIGFSGFGADNASNNAQIPAVIDEAARYGATAEFMGPATFDPAAQSALICDAATSGRYQALILLPIDSASSVPCVKQAIAAGIKIATVQFPAGPDVTATQPQVEGVVTQIREDVLLNARTIADGVIKSCVDVDPCEVQIMWGVSSLGFDAVKPAAFYQELKSYSNIKVVCEGDANYTEDLGRTLSADCLSAHPNIHVIASAADESIKGAEESVLSAGKTFGLGAGDIHLVGAYAQKYGVAQIKAGKWVQSYYSRVQSDVRAAVDLLLVDMKGGQVPNDVLTSDLDDVGYVIDADTFKKHPNLVGQW